MRPSPSRSRRSRSASPSSGRSDSTSARKPASGRAHAVLAHLLEHRVARAQLALRRVEVAGQGLDLGADDRSDGPPEAETELLVDGDRVGVELAGLGEVALHRAQAGERGPEPCLEGRRRRVLLEQLGAAPNPFLHGRRPVMQRLRIEHGEDALLALVACAACVHDRPLERLGSCAPATRDPVRLAEQPPRLCEPQLIVDLPRGPGSRAPPPRDPPSPPGSAPCTTAATAARSCPAAPSGGRRCAVAEEIPSSSRVRARSHSPLRMAALPSSTRNALRSGVVRPEQRERASEHQRRGGHVLAAERTSAGDSEPARPELGESVRSRVGRREVGEIHVRLLGVDYRRSRRARRTRRAVGAQPTGEPFMKMSQERSWKIPRRQRPQDEERGGT